MDGVWEAEGNRGFAICMHRPSCRKGYRAFWEVLTNIDFTVGGYLEGISLLVSQAGFQVLTHTVGTLESIWLVSSWSAPQSILFLLLTNRNAQSDPFWKTTSPKRLVSAPNGSCSQHCWWNDRPVGFNGPHWRGR